MTNNSKNRLAVLKDAVELLATSGKWGAFFIGGFCMLLYTNEIEQFPEGLQLGEGLAFYLVSAGFLVAYAFYAIGITALGCVVLRWPTQWVHNWGIKCRRRKSSMSTDINRLNPDLPTDFAAMWDGTAWGMAFLGLLMSVLISRGDLPQLWPHMATSLVQGTLVALLLMSRRRHQLLETGLVAVNESQHDLPKRKMGSTIFQRVLTLMIFFAPLLFAGDRLALVDAAFRIAQLRRENAVVHVQKPWAQRLVDSSMKSHQSFLGDNYLQFDGVKVLLRSVGDKVVIEMPEINKIPAKKLSIPSEQIYIE